MGTQTKPAGRARRPRRSQQERTAATRGKLIRGTVESIAALGFAGASVTQIARRAGVSRGALQHHFGAKSDLLMSVIDHLNAALRDALALAPAAAGTIEERCAGLIDTLWGIYGDRAYLTALEIMLGSRRERRLHERVFDVRWGTTAVLTREWARIFADVDGGSPAMADLRLLVFSTLRGLSVLRMFVDDEDFFDRQVALLKSMLVERLRNARPAPAR